MEPRSSVGFIAPLLIDDLRRSNADIPAAAEGWPDGNWTSGLRSYKQI